MNKTFSFYWFVIFISSFKNAFSEESIPSRVNFKGKYTSDIKNYEIVVPQRVNKDGSFISHLVSHHHSKRSTKDMEFIFYKIPIGGKDYLIELTPNRKLISPGAVVEIHKENVRKSEDRKFLNESSTNEKIGEMFRNLDIRKLENTECHFSGTVKGENISKAALSTCYGLAGFIQITKGFYTIEPVAEHDPFVEDAYPHMLYKTDGVENSSVCHTIGQLTTSLVDQLVRKRRESNVGLSLPIYIETLIVMDKALINHHRNSDCENYVLTVFNMAFNLFHDASSGLMMTLTIVRIIRLEVENDEMNLKVNADAEKTLRYFQTWQYEINPGDDSHPNHHDIAVLITRVNVCFSPSSCGLLGLTTIGKACDPKLSAALCEDNGLRLGYVIAHEIGHLLGADHDSGNSTSNGTDTHGLKTVMDPHVPLSAQTWSSCSQAYFKAFFGSGLGSCFLDEPEEHHFNVQDLLPGVMYNADFQCKHLIAMNARECDMGSTCDSLNCYVPGYACIVTHKPPADGTGCGENMWCHETKCLVVGERPGAVDGNWGEWSAWSECTRTCGSGVASSERNCDKPQPSHGGKNCVGERKRYKICAATITTVPQNLSDLIRFISEEVNVSFVGKPCETGRPSFRDIQCGEFNDWIYPEDGKVHTWKAYFFHDDNPCILYCISEEKQVVALRPRVVDGTMCYRGIRDVCIAGVCKSLPCDLHFESNAVEDACGVCHGDGTGCEFSEGIETFTQLKKGVTKLVTIPSGSRNIKVEEMSPTAAKIIVRDKDTRDIYIRGKCLGMFNVPGSQAWLGMVKKNQEALNIPGPVSKPLSIWIQRLDNVTVKWSMALPAEQQRKPEFGWDYLKWGPCSAKCGPGTQISKPSCMEGKAGLVEDSFCADLEEPPPKVRQCEVTKCEPRWMVGDWKGCEPTSEKKERKRVVYCIKPIGEGEGESQIVPDTECQCEPKPHATEPCENRQKREDTEYSQDNIDADSTFRSDTSEFGFHKKYEDYLKHFAALPVPQRNSETIPLHLVSSPHFKHYFHVLETPDDSETDSGSDMEVNTPNGTSYGRDAQSSRVSPDFYKETFSGQQIDVSHVQSLSEESASKLENRTKKSAIWEPEPVQNGSDSSDVNIGLKKKRSERTRKRRFSKLKRAPFRGSRDNSLKDARDLNAKFFQPAKKQFVYTSPNLTKILQTLSQRDKIKFLNLLCTGKRGDMLTERETLKKYEMKVLKSKMTSHKRGFLSMFAKKKMDPEKEAKNPEKGDNTERNFMNSHGFDGSGLRRLPMTGAALMEETMRSPEVQKLIKEERSSYENPFDPMCIAKSDSRLRKGFNDRRATDALSEKTNKANRRKKRTRIAKKSKTGRLRKRKRSSRIWKKPKSKDSSSKSGKEACGSVCGIETKNYLNNLFRDARPKTPTTKPCTMTCTQEMKRPLKKPVIKEGVLVIDKDMAENQEIEIIFDEAEDDVEGNRKKYAELPQPDKNERKLTIKGQDVFNLFQHLQERSGREAFYRLHDNDLNKIEISIKVPGKSLVSTTKSKSYITTTVYMPKMSKDKKKGKQEERKKSKQEGNKKKSKEDDDSDEYEVDEAVGDNCTTVCISSDGKKTEEEEKKKKKKKKKAKKKKGKEDDEDDDDDDDDHDDDYNNDKDNDNDDNGNGNDDHDDDHDHDHDEENAGKLKQDVKICVRKEEKGEKSKIRGKGKMAMDYKFNLNRFR